MGNSNTRESRPPGAGESHEGHRSSDGRSRHRSRTDTSFLGISTSSQRDRRQNVPFEHRETKQEREARRLERERATRLKDRERSLQEEHVDGGYLVTLGTYMGTEDFNKPVIERRLAPFWRGLNEWSDNWAEHQLVAAARGLPVPAADEPPPPELIAQPHNRNPSQSNLQNLTVPMGERSMSTASDHSGSGTTSGLASPGTPTRSTLKPRAKALAMALTGHSRNASSAELQPAETALPQDPFVNGQLLEVYLYKDATECPICFLSYPPYLNSTRCCDQAICSECFVQIKRADPHLPEHHPDGQERDSHQEVNPENLSEMLTSVPSACPYCQQPDFGVTYDPPPFRRGLVYSTSSMNLASSSSRSPMSSQSSLHPPPNPSSVPQTGRRRGHSLSANAPNVITTDRIRPDWSSKLATARAHQARRAAAATALHTAAFLVGGSDQRSMLRTGRFNRRQTGSGSGSGTPGTGSMAADGTEASESSDRTQIPSDVERNRRFRMDELEDMMFMEAVRLSLAAEEDRKKKEAKAMRKEAKKKEQAEKKAAKKAAKDPYGGSVSGASGSSLSLSLGLGRKRGNSSASQLRMDATVQGASQVSKGDTTEASSQNIHNGSSGDGHGKGKSVDRGETDAAAEGSSSSAIPIRSGGSHLRQMSNASSLGSSLADSAPGSFSSPGFLHLEGIGQSRGEGREGEESEPLFNFRSLAELVGVNIDQGTALEEENEGTARKGPGDATQETQARPLSQVREEDELAPGHDEKEAASQAQIEEAEKSQAQRSLYTEETLISRQDADRGKDAKSPHMVEFIEEAVTTKQQK
ncbi:C2H2 zinc finger [Cordyceps militaris]|uniref:C2H2 zinc finger n=1 Tax=Cordyceps militaris TaxID=73501 RepID=A0A2H4SQ82_CORMI|nr:C2H2 zinc finger [Cordyceps militaris]